MKAKIDPTPYRIEMTPWEVGQLKKALRAVTETVTEETMPLLWLLNALDAAERDG